MATQVERVRRFVQVKNLEEFHRADNSMGGYSAGANAVTYPDDVLSLVLFDADRVKSPRKSEYQTLREKGEKPLMVGDTEGYT